MLTWLIIRLALALFFFAVALHALLRNPTIWGWYVTIVATECGRVLLPITLLVFAIGACWTEPVALAGTIVLVLATTLFLKPIFSFALLMRRLPTMLTSAFGKSSGEDEKLSEESSIKTAITSGTHVYSDDEGKPRSLFFFRAPGSNSAPCIIVLHGGGWEKGSPHEFEHWNLYWARRGYSVAALEYRFAPKHPWPAQLEDVRQALRFLKQNAASLGIDATRFILIGRSAGGQIATAAAYGLHDPSIRGVVSVYAPADMVFAREYARADDLLDSLGLVRRLLGGDPHEARENYRTSSGILLANEKSCPTLLIHGAFDTLVWVKQSQRLARRLSELKVPNCYVELSWATHGFDWLRSGPGSAAMRRAVDFFLQSEAVL